MINLLKSYYTQYHANRTLLASPTLENSHNLLNDNKIMHNTTLYKPEISIIKNKSYNNNLEVNNDNILNTKSDNAIDCNNTSDTSNTTSSIINNICIFPTRAVRILTNYPSHVYKVSSTYIKYIVNCTKDLILIGIKLLAYNYEDVLKQVTYHCHIYLQQLPDTRYFFNQTCRLTCLVLNTFHRHLNVSNNTKQFLENILRLAVLRNEQEMENARLLSIEYDTNNNVDYFSYVKCNLFFGIKCIKSIILAVLVRWANVALKVWIVIGKQFK